ncbi:MAG: L-threonylcarbamoyladenylate synthase [Balneolaceae bacterium]
MPDISFYISLINAGEIVAFPTETVYGLGADAWNPSAIKKVFEQKGRPSDNPLIVHISSVGQVSEFASEIPESAIKLMNAFWPGPLTIVLNKKAKVLDLISAGLNTVALRMPNHPIALNLISETGALVAPSANKSGRPSPTKAEHVLADFGDDFPVIDGGAAKIGIESTVIDLTSEVPSILRPGKIGKTEIESVLGKEISISDGENINTPKSPGQKYSHYKPKAGIQHGSISVIEDNILHLVQDEKFSASKNVIQYSGNLELLSRELYDRFRQADIEGYASVFIEQIEAYQEKYPSLYTALINRIQKAVD